MIVNITKENINLYDDNFIPKDYLINELKNNPYSKILFLIKNNEIIGYIYYSVIYERVEINQIEIKLEKRNHGYGNLLIKELLKREKKDITLEVNENNYPAIKLYEKNNFIKKAVRKNYYNDEDGLLYERKYIINNFTNKWDDKMKDMYILGIESSCDETSISIVKNGREEIATIISSQIDIHKDYGGVVPEIASRQHVKNITFVLEECLNKANMTMDDIDAIAITYGPGLIGSLLIGLEAAKTLSFIYNKPLIPVHHIAGHIYANSLVNELQFPLLAVVVSGGHTELIEMDEHYKFTKLGGTLDDAIGECYDKVARVIGLEYPGGPKIDKLAKIGKPTYKLPIPLHDDSYNFSFSGLKSAVINLVHNEKQRGNEIRKVDLATSFQKTAVESITSKTKKAIIDRKIKNVIIAGGVAANSGLREAMTKLTTELGVNLSIPSMKYCTDNGAMIAAAGYYAYKNGRIADLSLNSKSQDTLK